MPRRDWEPGVRLCLRLPPAPSFGGFGRARMRPPVMAGCGCVGSFRRISAEQSAPRCNTSTATPPAPDGTAWSNATQQYVQLRHLFAGLTNGTAYAFEARAVNAVGSGPPATVTVTPMTVACPAPSLGNRRQHWRGDLTIDARTPANGDPPASVGFVTDDGPTRGSISDTDFTLGAQAYGITAAWVGDVVSTGVLVPGDLVFGFDRDLTEAHKAALRLHVCGTAYDFSNSDGPDFVHTYLWEDNLGVSLRRI